MPTNNIPTLPFSLLPSRKNLVATQPNIVYATATLSPPMQMTGAPRAPLNLSVALDVSGSMNELVRGLVLPRVPELTLGYGYVDPYTRTSALSKLDLAKYSIARLIEHLTDQDTLSLVVFESAVRVVMHPTRMTPVGKAQMLRSLDSARTGGNTALAEGLRLALTMLGDARPGVVSRAMLFTDGQANTGPVTAQAIGEYIASKRQGHSISTFGFGEGYSGELLSALVHEGGAGYFIATPDMLPTAFGTELGSLVSLYATSVEVTFEPHIKGMQMRVMNDLRTEVDATGKTRVFIPTLLHGQAFDVVLELSLPKRSHSQREPVGALGAEVRFTTAQSGQEGRAQADLTFNFVGKRAGDTKDEPYVMSALAVQEAARVQKEAVEYAKKGDFAGARQALNAKAADLMMYGRADLAGVTRDSATLGFASASAYSTVGEKMAPSLMRSYTRQTAATGGLKVGGVDVDATFANNAQKSMSAAFSITKATTDADDMPDVNSMVTK